MYREPAEIAEDMPTMPKEKKPLPRWVSRVALAFVAFLIVTILLGLADGNVVAALRVYAVGVLVIAGISSLLSLIPEGM